MIRLAMEAIAVGIATVICGLLVHVVFGYHSKHADSPKMKEEMIALCVTLFFTGFFLHLIFEGLGWNRSYCQAKLSKKSKY